VEPGELRHYAGVGGPPLLGEAAASRRRSSSSQARLDVCTSALPRASESLPVLSLSEREQASRGGGSQRTRDSSEARASVRFGGSDGS